MGIRGTENASIRRSSFLSTYRKEKNRGMPDTMHRNTPLQKSEQITDSMKPRTPMPRTEMKITLNRYRVRAVRIPSTEYSFSSPLARTNWAQSCRKEEVQI